MTVEKQLSKQPSPFKGSERLRNGQTISNFSLFHQAQEVVNKNENADDDGGIGDIERRPDADTDEVGHAAEFRLKAVNQVSQRPAEHQSKHKLDEPGIQPGVTPPEVGGTDNDGDGADSGKGSERQGVFAEYTESGAGIGWNEDNTENAPFTKSITDSEIRPNPNFSQLVGDQYEKRRKVEN
jgi:hypothetical protein